MGTRALAAKYGHSELGMQVKGLEAPGYDPRGSFGMSIAYATSDRGACHMRSFPIGVEVVEGTMPADTLDESKAEFNVDLPEPLRFQVLRHLVRLLGDRLRADGHADEAPLEARRGRRGDDAGRRARLEPGASVQPARGLHQGRRRGPRSLAREAVHRRRSPPARSSAPRDFNEVLGQYYALRGWDENGVPTEAKLTELGIDVRL